MAQESYTVLEYRSRGGRYVRCGFCKADIHAQTYIHQRDPAISCCVRCVGRALQVGMETRPRVVLLREGDRFEDVLELAAAVVRAN